MRYASFALAWLLLLNVVGAAQGQTSAATTQANPSPNAGAAINGFVPTQSSETGFITSSTGWNFAHALVCEPYYDGTSVWLFVYLKEGGYLYTNFKPFQDALMPSCQSGNFIGFYLESASNWSHALVYSYK